MTTINESSAAVTGGSRSAATSGDATASPAPASAGGGQTSATSGAAVAMGLSTHNTVTNNAAGSVGVAGANEAPVTVQSGAKVNINDTGVSSAQSGSAAAGTTTTQPVLAAAPAPGTGSSSGPAVATGLTTQASVDNQLQASRVVPGGTTSADPVNITQTQSVTVFTGGSGVAASGAACGGPPCASSSGAGVTGATTTQQTQAVSGQANAEGLVADNTVSTHGMASVSVAGRNFAPIQVIIDAITWIANWGSASAVSGSASSSNVPANGLAVSGTTATSGATQAVGAQVRNQIDLRSSANVHVTGDNHNPINIVLNLAASLLNLGVGVARSGDAQTSAASNQAGGLASATSGWATATGLAIQNAINMEADAYVQVDGDNYAPISIRIHFYTAIDNRGWAQASTGTARAGGDPTKSMDASRSSSEPSNGSAGPGRNAARSGSATVIGDSVNVSAISLQSANANGVPAGQTPDPQASTAAAGMWAEASRVALRNQSPPDLGVAPTNVQSGSQAISGDVLSSGMQTTVDVLNVQTSACTTPSTACAAANSSSLAVQVEPAPTPDLPIPTIQAQPDGAPPTPGQPVQPGNGNSSKGSGQHSVETPASPSGPPVLVTPFADIAPRRLPPLPKQAPRQAPGVVVGRDPWSVQTGPDRLPPLPGLVSAQDAEISAAGATAGAHGLGEPPLPGQDRGRPGPAASASSPLAAETPPLPTAMDASPWTVLTEPQQPSMSAQTGGSEAAQPIPISPQPVLAELATVALAQADQAPPDPAATPLDPIVFGIGASAGIALAAAGAVSTSRGRRWLARQLRRWLALLRFV